MKTIKKPLISTKKSRFLRFLGLFLGITLFLILVFSVTYFPIVNKPNKEYKNAIKTISEVISDTNHKCSSYKSGNSIEEEKLKENIPQFISKLKEANSTITTISIPSNYRDDHKNLLTGLDNNIKLYQQMLAILSNPKSNDLTESLNDFKGYLQSTRNSYFVINDSMYSVKLDKTFNDFTNDFINYTNHKITENTQNANLLEKQSKFINKFDSTLNSFQKLLSDSDLKYSLSRIHQDNYDYTNILKEIKDLKSSFESFSEEFDKITFPEEANSLKEKSTSLKSNLKTQIENLDSLITSEYTDVFSASSEKKAKTLQKHYESLYTEIDENLKTLTSSFNSLSYEFISYRSKFI